MRLRVRLTVLFAMAVCQAQGGERSFPFTLSEGLIWVKVRVPEAAEPLNFLLDTGANVSVVNLTTARRLGLAAGHRVCVQGVGASSTGYWPERLSASASEVTLPESYLAVDLSELSGACRCRVDGLIGADFFGGRAVQIDFAARQIRLLPSGRTATGQTIIPMKSRHGGLRVAVRVNGRPSAWFRVDTGCASSLEWAGATSSPMPIGQRVAVALTPVAVGMAETTVQLGHFSFQKVPTGLHAKPIFPAETGLLGNELLSRFRAVTVDIPAGRLLLE